MIKCWSKFLMNLCVCVCVCSCVQEPFILSIHYSLLEWDHLEDLHAKVSSLNSIVALILNVKEALADRLHSSL